MNPVKAPVRKQLTFSGIQKTTLVDYPQEVACTLFLAGCNFRCPYCYNVSLVSTDQRLAQLSDSAGLEFLKSRLGFLDGVCITGGEPLLHFVALRPFLKKVKALGFKIKLDTNGSFPRALAALIDAGLVDYVAMDIKAPLYKYAQVTRRETNLKAICESVERVREGGIEYEFRTTVSSDLLIEDFDAIGRWLQGSRRYYLQSVKLDVPILEPAFAQRHTSLDQKQLQALANRLKPYFDEVRVRG